MQIDMPQGAKNIIQCLNNAGCEAYIVGGCVRDSLMGKKPSDWDICTSANPNRMMEILASYRLIPTGIQHGTITVLESDGAYEVTTFRIDGEYKDHRHPEGVSFTSKLEKDLSRRDFTINAMAWHPEKGVIDLFEGMKDLKNRIVRAVGEPCQRFDEDGLRMLRMVRFATVLDFDYDERTYAAAKQMNYLLQYISKERIQVEMNKILLSNHVSRGLQDLYDLGMYTYFFPEICHQVGFLQNTHHHFLDVFEHSILATGLVESELILRLTMFLHDIAKPFVWHEETSHDAFPGHAEEGAKIAQRLLNNLKYDNYTKKQVCTLIAHHNDFIENNDISVRHYLSILGEEQMKRLIKVKVADLMAHDLKDKRNEMIRLFNEIEKRVDNIIKRGDCFTIKQLVINGQDLINLGFHGSDVGNILKRCLEAVIENQKMNQKDKLMDTIINV